MKKLMIAAAIVCAAAFANAANMNWKVITGTAGLDIYICESVTAFESAAQIASYLYGESGNTGTSASQSRGAWFGNSGVVEGIDDSPPYLMRLSAVLASKYGGELCKVRRRVV